jgi:hypothetical protein
MTEISVLEMRRLEPSAGTLKAIATAKIGVCIVQGIKVLHGRRPSMDQHAAKGRTIRGRRLQLEAFDHGRGSGRVHQVTRGRVGSVCRGWVVTRPEKKTAAQTVICRRLGGSQSHRKLCA